MNSVCPRSLDPVHIVTCYIGQDFSDRQYTQGLEFISNAFPGRKTRHRSSVHIFISEKFTFIIKWTYWLPQKLPQIYTVIASIRIGKVAWCAVYICGNFWVTQYNNWIHWLPDMRTDRTGPDFIYEYTVCPGSSDPTENIESNYFIQ